MSVTSFQVLLEFVNKNLINNTKPTTPVDNEMTFEVDSSKYAVMSVFRAKACADCLVAATHNAIH